LKTFAKRREKIRAVRLGEGSTEELEAAGIVRRLGNGTYVVATGLGSSIGYEGNWVCILSEHAVSILTDDEFQRTYEEA